MLVEDAVAARKLRQIDAIRLNDPLKAKGVDSPDPQIRRINSQIFYAFLNFVCCAMRIGDGNDNPLVCAP